VTVDGLPVRGLAGNITIPAEGGVNGLHIDQTGRVTVNGADVGQLELVRVSKDRQQELLAAGDSLFSSPDPASVEVFDGEVLQGYVENSNVSPIDELINIMVSSRQYEAARKAMTAIDESTRARIDLN
jgi:flagellar basal-body rod protein FlgG